MSIMRYNITAEALAREFSRIVREELGEHLHEIRVRNKRYKREFPNNSICATHDFCDANMLMLEAVSNLTGVPENEIDLEVTMPVMNVAWDMAKAADFIWRDKA